LVALALISYMDSIIPEFSTILNDKTLPLSAEGFLAKAGKTIEEED